MNCLHLPFLEQSIQLHTWKFLNSHTIYVLQILLMHLSMVAPTPQSVLPCGIGGDLKLRFFKSPTLVQI